MAIGRTWPALAVALALAGCDEWIVEVESRVRPDGALVRQTTITYKGDEKDDAKRFAPFRLADLSVVERTPERLRLEAFYRGPEEARGDIVLAPSGGRPEPRNEIDWSRVDEVFFDRYTYRERYRDSVDVDRLADASDRLRGLLVAIVLEAVKADAGDRYDLGPLHAWLDGPAARCFQDVARIVFTEKDSKKLEARVLGRLELEGLRFDPDATSDSQEEAILRFAAQKLEELLAPRAGQPAYDGRSLLVRDDEGRSRAQRLLEQAVVQLHGSEEKGEEAIIEAVRACTGDAERYSIRFTVAVSLPGRILRTNGIVDPDAPGRAVFRFGTNDIARSGHVLEVETIVPKPDVLAALPKAKAAIDAALVLDTLEALKDAKPEDRAALGAAVRTLAEAPADTVREKLPERLRETFDKLVNLGSAN